MSAGAPEQKAVPILADDPIEYWRGLVGERWTAEQAHLDATLRPFGDAAMAAAAVRAGERVVDVGCGCGDTTLVLGTRVGADGSVLGIDVSPPMLARARERGAGRANVRFEERDAATLGADTRATLLYSRFGVMFFAEPERAFAALRASLAPGGRLAFVCWRALVENPWMAVPLAAARTVVDAPAAQGGEREPPGPFAFARRARLEALLAASGFNRVTVAPFDHDVRMGADPSAAAAFALSNGPTAALLRTLTSDAERARVGAAVVRALEPHMKAQGVALAGATWIVTAGRPD